MTSIQGTKDCPVSQNAFILTEKNCTHLGDKMDISSAYQVINYYSSKAKNIMMIVIVKERSSIHV